MSVLAELMSLPGVLAAGEYAFRGDRFSYRGALSEEQARKLSIVCRATTMAAVMAGDMLRDLSPPQGLSPIRGWMLRGEERTLCVMANVFCLLDNARANTDAVQRLLQAGLSDTRLDLV